MKKIEAVIRVEKLDAVKDQLEKAGYPGMMVTRIEGHGAQKGQTAQFRGREYKVDMIPKYKVEVVCSGSDCESIVKAISDAARTGNIGDGKIFISTVDDVVRIRTSETGEVAI